MNNSEISDKKIVKMVFTALFAAIICVVTMMIRLPSLGPNGCVNIGDTFVLLSAWVIGGPYGALAAGIGSGLADLLAGYGVYVPGTAIIKFAMAFAAWILYRIVKGKDDKKSDKAEARKAAAYLSSAIIAEVIMVVGYFVYEFFILGYGSGAAAAIISNLFQGGANIIISVVIVNALERVHLLGMVKRLLV